MKTTSTRIILTGLICFGLLTMASCSKKSLVTHPDTNQATVEQPPPQNEETADTAGDISEQELAENARREQQAREQAAREQAAREKKAEEALGQFTGEHILFAYDSDLLDEAAKAVIQKKMTWLQGNPSASITIEGHCDLRGTTSYNLALGERRAASVRNYLRDLGVHSQRMTVISFGEEQPLDTAQTEKAHQKNRRAQFKVNTSVTDAAN
jgi:peptidoglycan-associated lipoprotein